MSIQGDTLRPLLLRHSSFYKLLMSVAWLLRFENYLCCQSGEVKSENLTADKIVTTTREVVKVVQRQAVPKELALLSRISHGLRLLLWLPEETI